MLRVAAIWHLAQALHFAGRNVPRSRSVPVLRHCVLSADNDDPNLVVIDLTAKQFIDRLQTFHAGLLRRRGNALDGSGIDPQRRIANSFVSQVVNQVAVHSG